MRVCIHGIVMRPQSVSQPQYVTSSRSTCPDHMWVGGGEAASSMVIRLCTGTYKCFLESLSYSCILLVNIIMLSCTALWWEVEDVVHLSSLTRTSKPAFEVKIPDESPNTIKLIWTFCKPQKCKQKLQYCVINNNVLASSDTALTNCTPLVCDSSSQLKEEAKKILFITSHQNLQCNLRCEEVFGKMVLIFSYSLLAC